MEKILLSTFSTDYTIKILTPNPLAFVVINQTKEFL